MKKLFLVILIITIFTCIPQQKPKLNPNMMIIIPYKTINWQLQLYEIMEFRFNDGLYFYVTTNSDSSINIPKEMMRVFVENIFKRKMSDVKFIIHNHFTSEEISNIDLKGLLYFRNEGFQGDYIIYYRGLFWKY